MQDSGETRFAERGNHSSTHAAPISLQRRMRERKKENMKQITPQYQAGKFSYSRTVNWPGMCTPQPAGKMRLNRSAATKPATVSATGHLGISRWNYRSQRSSNRLNKYPSMPTKSNTLNTWETKLLQGPKEPIGSSLKTTDGFTPLV